MYGAASLVPRGSGHETMGLHVCNTASGKIVLGKTLEWKLEMGIGNRNGNTNAPITGAVSFSQMHM